VASVVGEMHVTGTFSEALAGAVVRTCAGAIGAVVQGERAGLDDGCDVGSVIVQPKLALGGTVASATITSAGFLTSMV
jgi:hypothetical protein